MDGRFDLRTIRPIAEALRCAARSFRHSMHSLSAGRPAVNFPPRLDELLRAALGVNEKKHSIGDGKLSVDLKKLDPLVVCSHDPFQFPPSPSRPIADSPGERP